MEQRKHLTVLSYFNKALDNDHLSLYLSQRMRGQPVSFHQFIKRLIPPSDIKQNLLDQLYMYCHTHELTKIPKICNVFQGYHPDYDKERIEEKLHNNLKLIGFEDE